LDFLVQERRLRNNYGVGKMPDPQLSFLLLVSFFGDVYSISQVDEVHITLPPTPLERGLFQSPPFARGG